jgi:hypothetical protein
MLQALPDTGLWHRLNKEGRMITQNSNGHQTTLMNFMPTRPLEDIATEYVHAFWTLYDPLVFLNRTYRHFLILGESQYKRIKREKSAKKKRTDWTAIKALLMECLGISLACHWSVGPWFQAAYLLSPRVPTLSWPLTSWNS